MKYRKNTALNTLEIVEPNMEIITTLLQIGLIFLGFYRYNQFTEWPVL